VTHGHGHHPPDCHASGFTLLEVLVAISILGLGLTAILSAQTGLFASSRYAEHVSVSTALIRCRMSEMEIKLSKEGYPLTDVKEEGTCCGDEPSSGYRCKWKIEKVELPLPPTNTNLSSALGSSGGIGALGAIASVGQSNGAVLGQSPQLGDVSRLLAGSGTGQGLPAPASSDGFGTSFGGPQTPGAGPLGGGTPGGFSGTSSLAPLVMTMVYPTLKPMLEASIRKLTVTVEWKDGERTKNVEAVQFVTNPQQGGLDPNAAQGLDALTQSLGLGGGTPGASQTGGAAPGSALGGGTSGGGLLGGGILGGGILGGSK
jgi:general secretion pathway protein I